MILQELVKTNSWLSVKAILTEIYPEEEPNIDAYEEVFDFLKNAHAEESVYIIVFEEQDDEILVSGMEAYEEEDENGNRTTYSLEFTPWEEWLGMEIDPQTLKNYSELEILAHVLLEMTFVSFDPEEIKEEKKKLEKIINEMENQPEDGQVIDLQQWQGIKKKSGGEEDDKGTERLN